MLSNDLLEELNGQIRMEFESSYYYLGIVAFCESTNFKGAAHFFRIQQQEEFMHAMKLFDYVVTRQSGHVELQAIAAPDQTFESLQDAFASALRNERRTTESIRRILEKAHDEKDYATVNLLNWYADEQAEEESLMEYFLDRLGMVGKDGPGLILIDNELLARSPDITGSTGGN